MWLEGLVNILQKSRQYRQKNSFFSFIEKQIYAEEAELWSVDRIKIRKKWVGFPVFLTFTWIDERALLPLSAYFLIHKICSYYVTLFSIGPSYPQT